MKIIEYKMAVRPGETNPLKKEEPFATPLRGKTVLQLADLKDRGDGKTSVETPTDTLFELLLIERVDVLDIRTLILYKENNILFGNAAGSSRIFLMGIVTRLAAGEICKCRRRGTHVQVCNCRL
jgi:hypothetical protein